MKTKINLDNGVVLVVPFSVHAANNAVRFEKLTIVLGGVLTSVAVMMEKLPRGLLALRHHPYGFQHQSQIHEDQRQFASQHLRTTGRPGILTLVIFRDVWEAQRFVGVGPSQTLAQTLDN